MVVELKIWFVQVFSFSFSLRSQLEVSVCVCFGGNSDASSADVRLLDLFDVMMVTVSDQVITLPQICAVTSLTDLTLVPHLSSRT